MKNRERLHFVTDLAEALKIVKVCFISVGTPPGEDGSADLSYVLKVAKSIGKHMVRHMFVVDKSTVPVGTAVKVRAVIQEELDKRQSRERFRIFAMHCENSEEI